MISIFPQCCWCFSNSQRKGLARTKEEYSTTLMVPRIFAPTFLLYINLKPPGLEATYTSPLEVATSIPERMVWKNVSPASNMASPFGYRHVIFRDGPLSFSPRITSQKKKHDIGKSRVFNRKYIFKWLLSVVYFYHFQKKTEITRLADHPFPCSWRTSAQTAANLWRCPPGGWKSGKKQLPPVNSHSHGQCTLLMEFTMKDGIFHGYVSLLDGNLRLSDFFVGLWRGVDWG